MSLTIVLGACWGDEAKAKIVDILAEKSDVVVRFQGGCNAGHTVVHKDKKYIFHIIPVGILYPDKKCIIANGVVINPFQLISELEDIQKQNIDVGDRLFISSQAHITLPLHKFLDGLSEKKSKKQAIGTTKRGIGPTYSDKFARFGIRVADLLDPKYLYLRIDNIINNKRSQIADWLEETDLEDMKRNLVKIGKKIQHFVIDTPFLINKYLNEGKRVLYEGAQGTLLDIDFGTYPFVTSSNTSIGGAISGSGVNPRRIDKIIGVMKSYFTRVGNGPFPTELKNEIGDYIREKGHEYGATTGRPRRCGWFDAIIAKYSAMINGFDEIALTLLDVYSGLKTIKICTHYEIDGERVDHFPIVTNRLEKVIPKFITIKGWNEVISNIKEFSDLPINAQNFVHIIEEILNIKVSIISVGAEKNQTIFRN
ncbi:MAG: adenylosuccinate synthase [Candidatus Cloacimonetes bacterium]|nr:adenylosuccinate synthase [Candidatus Cloacimonadota bacterium]